MHAVNNDQEGEAIALELVDAFVAFVPAYVKWMKACLPEDNLTHGRLRLLHALHRHGPQTMSDLSDELETTPRNVTTLVDALEREGFAGRHPHPTDRRATVIELTPRGLEASAKVYEEYTTAVARLFSELPETDQHELLRLVTTLRSVLSDKRERS